MKSLRCNIFPLTKSQLNTLCRQINHYCQIRSISSEVIVDALQRYANPRSETTAQRIA